MTPRRLAWLIVLVLTGTLGYFMTRVPIQLSDGASNMISLADSGAWQVFLDKATNKAFFRPLMWPPYRLVMDASGGAYFLWFKAIHVLQVLVLLALFLRLVRVQTFTDVVAFLFGVAVLVGGHTFPGTVREAFPINHFLAIGICALAVMVMASERPRRVYDVLAVLLLVYAALTLESGLLVWVIAVLAWMMGFRGISRTAIGVMSLAVAAYLVVRFGWFHTGTPNLVERASGFGFRSIEAPQIQERFGGRPLLFYGYNVAAAVLTLLFAEPRGGVFWFTRDLVEGPLEAWVVVNVLCATGVTVLIAVTIWRRRRAGDYGSHHDQMLWMAPLLILANAVFCYAYVKDVVLSVAGIFVAAAAFVGMRDALERLTTKGRRAAALSVVMLTLLAAGWSIKLIGIHYSIRRQAVAVRREWALVDSWLAREHILLDSPAKQGVKARLEHDALERALVPPWPNLPWSPSWFDETQ